MDYDVVIIGGGPAGSSAGTHLAEAGLSVLLLEKETFPRFHVGESLLPYNIPLLEELGLMPAMEEAGFTVKRGAQFAVGSGHRHLAVSFGNGSFTEHPTAFQVERSRFDEILLRRSARAGVEVREGCTVTGFHTVADGVQVEPREGTFRGRFLIDASGTANFTGTRLGLRQGYEHHRKVALFAHFRHVDLPEEGQAGDIVIVRMENSWFWLIPVAPDRVSVGLVVDSRELREGSESPEELFERRVRESAFLRPRLAAAERVGPLRRIADFSYLNRSFVGPRLVRVGDAAGFLDPIFSSGVYLAMLSGKEAAAVVREALAQGSAFTPAMRRYERRLLRSMRVYWRMIEAFYSKAFIELLLQPERYFHLPCAVNAILAGRLDNAWKVRWRLEMFFLLVRLQKWFGIVPRLRFS